MEAVSSRGHRSQGQTTLSAWLLTDSGRLLRGTVPQAAQRIADEGMEALRTGASPEVFAADLDKLLTGVLGQQAQLERTKHQE